MTHAMARSSPAPRLASLGVLLWAATSLAMPLDTPTGPAHETDGIAAHDISLQPAARDFERRRADVCPDDARCCKRFIIDVLEKPLRCEDYTYMNDAGCNCHQYYYYNSAPPPQHAHALRRRLMLTRTSRFVSHRGQGALPSVPQPGR